MLQQNILNVIEVITESMHFIIICKSVLFFQVTATVFLIPESFEDFFQMYFN